MAVQKIEFDTVPAKITFVSTVGNDRIMVANVTLTAEQIATLGALIKGAVQLTVVVKEKAV